MLKCIVMRSFICARLSMAASCACPKTFGDGRVHCCEGSLPLVLDGDELLVDLMKCYASNNVCIYTAERTRAVIELPD